MSALEKRLSYLGLADFDYLAARILLIRGLAFPGLPKAAEAFEKILKVAILLEAKISRDEELSAKRMRKFGTT